MVYVICLYLGAVIGGVFGFFICSVLQDNKDNHKHD